MKYYAIIVAGGLGSRMQSQVPKQFLLVNGKPVLMHTLEAFFYSDLKPELILTLNIHFHQLWEDLCKEYTFNIPHNIIKGGNERFYSVKNGLKAVKGTAIIAVHDAVRPLVSNDIITKSFRQAEETGSAVTGVISKDSIRQVNGVTSKALDRDTIYLMQTPQTFRSGILKKAYKQPFRTEFTDDAAVVEKSGTEIQLLPGDHKNIKITYPEDIMLAELFLKNKKSVSV